RRPQLRPLVPRIPRARNPRRAAHVRRLEDTLVVHPARKRTRHRLDTHLPRARPPLHTNHRHLVLVRVTLLLPRIILPLPPGGTLGRLLGGVEEYLPDLVLLHRDPLLRDPEDRR